nr:uncharacterized protein LOC123494394 isoform X2 [Aegilops tauschii subsp. strangulata]
MLVFPTFWKEPCTKETNTSSDGVPSSASSPRSASSTLMEYLLQRANSTSSSSHGGSQQQQQRSSSINTRISNSGTGRGAVASTRGEEQQQHGLAPPAAGEKQRRNKMQQHGLAPSAGTQAEKEHHGGAWEVDEESRETTEDARELLSTGSWRPAPAMPVVGSWWRTGGSSRWTRGSTRRTRRSSRTMRGSSCSTGSWWQIPATPAGNRRGRGSQRRSRAGLGGGGGASTWRRRPR